MPKTMKNETGALRELELFEMPEAERLLKTHQNLIAKLATNLARRGFLGADDLIAEGNLGLLKAAKKYSQAKGAKFTTYASYWIRQAMLRALDNKSRTVRLPWQAAAKLKKIESARIAFAGAHGRAPQENELAKAAGISRKTMRGLLDSCHNSVPLDGPRENARFASNCDVLELAQDNSPDPSELLDGKETAELFRRALSNLGKREATVLSLRFGLGREDGETASCDRVGAKLGLSREGVRKMQERSLSKLKAVLLPAFSGEAPQAMAV